MYVGQDVYMGMTHRCVIAHAATTIPYHTNMVDAATPPRALLMKVRLPMAFGQSTVNMLDAAPAVLEPCMFENVNAQSSSYHSMDFTRCA